MPQLSKDYIDTNYSLAVTHQKPVPFFTRIRTLQ